MKQRLGAILLLVLGAVLIAGGSLHAGAAGSAGVDPVACNSQAPEQVGGPPPCPTGTITITEQDAGAPSTPPTSWTVTIASPCIATEQLTVPDSDTATSGDLPIYTDDEESATCSYTLTETPVTGYTAAFDPASPETLNDDGEDNDLAVTLTNTAVAVVTTSSAPATTPAAAAATSSAAVAPVATSTAPAAALPYTGSRAPVRASLLAGIALCLLGGILLLTSFRVRRRHDHAA